MNVYLVTIQVDGKYERAIIGANSSDEVYKKLRDPKITFSEVKLFCYLKDITDKTMILIPPFKGF